jgi:hypothetical protein
MFSNLCSIDVNARGCEEWDLMNATKGALECEQPKEVKVEMKETRTCLSMKVPKFERLLV